MQLSDRRDRALHKLKFFFYQVRIQFKSIAAAPTMVSSHTVSAYS